MAKDSAEYWDSHLESVSKSKPEQSRNRTPTPDRQSLRFENPDSVIFGNHTVDNIGHRPPIGKDIHIRSAEWFSFFIKIIFLL